ncbi:hypothetical protein H0H92_006607 [Tricholoma furcatifolium]|nr:hypothetical protein H0H92_006607 [Tricholoma furcatifolium]
MGPIPLTDNSPSAIAGWIPEHIEIKGPNFEREKTWDRILEGFSRGYHHFSDEDFGLFKFFANSYAVIGVDENEGCQSLTVLDTWVNPNHEKQSQEPATSTRQTFLRFENRLPGAETEIWILLTRHVTDSSRKSDYISLKVRTKIIASLTSGVLSIFASYDGDGSEVGFTLAAYAGSNFEISWDQTTPSPPFTKKVDGILTSKNAGGNCTYPTFMVNPQYHLKVHPPRANGKSPHGSDKANVALTVQTSRDTPVNISLVYSRGERIDELVKQELVASSGAYTYGMARVRKEISRESSNKPARKPSLSYMTAGDYTVILSAFEPHHMGPYSFKTDSSHSFDILPISQEGAGMYAKVIRGAWTKATAVGGPTSDRYSKNPTFEISVPSATQIKIRLQLIRPFTATSLNITVFPAYPGGSLGRHIATSGAYSDAISGVTTPQFSLGPGKYLAVLSTYNPGVESAFQVLIYTTVAGITVTERTQT